MESFVPFGGFFSAPSDTKNSISGSYPSVSRCHPCNYKCQQEVTALSKGGYSSSVADQYQSSLPSWLQMAELGNNRGLDVIKVCTIIIFILEYGHCPFVNLLMGTARAWNKCPEFYISILYYKHIPHLHKVLYIL